MSHERDSNPRNEVLQTCPLDHSGIVALKSNYNLSKPILFKKEEDTDYRLMEMIMILSIFIMRLFVDLFTLLQLV